MTKETEPLKTYYRIILHYSDQNSGYLRRTKGGRKTISWLTYSSDDKGLTFSSHGKEDESLAIQILIANKDSNGIVKNALENVLFGYYEQVIVQKFMAVAAPRHSVYEQIGIQQSA